MRKCTKCLLSKIEIEFYKDKSKKSGYRSACKACENENRKGCPILAKKRKERLLNNPDIVRGYNKKSYQKNKSKKWLYKRNKRATDERFRIIENLRGRARNFINKQAIYSKDSSTQELLGADYETVYNHIESLFVEGMSWSLVGSKVHIDHIIPLSSAKNIVELKNLFNYKNLQPLWAIDNLKKGSKIF